MGDTNNVRIAFGIMPLPSVDRLCELFSYDPESGDFTWLVDRGRIAAGTVAGYLMPNGYRYIRVDMVKYAAHRLAWKYVTGEDPSEFIDHLNGNKSDNRFLNLRKADVSENNFNKRRKPSSESKFKGVTRIIQRGRVAYSASICARGVRHFVGNFDTPEEASAAYFVKAKEVHGEFANVG